MALPDHVVKLREAYRRWDETKGSIHFTPEEFVVEGDRVVMIGRCAFRHRRTGKVVDTAKCDVWRFRQGKAVDFMEFYDTAQALEATR
jgi:uncharacterized protein